MKSNGHSSNGNSSNGNGSSTATEQVVIDRIKVAKTQNPPDEKAVKALMKIIPVSGLPEPIIVCRPAPSMGVHLVKGRNELEACRRLGRRLILARVEQGGAAEAARWREIADIDDSLNKRGVGGVGPAQRAKLSARRKEVFEMLHPGVPGFEQDTAEKTGRARATVAHDLRRATSLGNDTLSKVTGTSLDGVIELDALAQMDRIERAETIERAARGEDVSAKAQEPTPGYAKLVAAWNAASIRGREKFMIEVGLTRAREAQYAVR